MAIFINSTQVITQIPTVDWNRISEIPANTVSSLIKTTSGDTTNIIGSPLVRVDLINFTVANTTLTVNFNTNCVIDCACACACACGG